jgi:hypothetical protein
MSVGVGGAFTYSLFKAMEIPLFLHANAVYHMPHVRGGTPTTIQPESFFRFSRYHSLDLGLGAEYQMGDFSPFLEFHTGVQGGTGWICGSHVFFHCFRVTPLGNKSLAFLLGADSNT